MSPLKVALVSTPAVTDVQRRQRRLLWRRYCSAAEHTETNKEAIFGKICLSPPISFQHCKHQLPFIHSIFSFKPPHHWSPVSESCVSSLKIPPTHNLTSHQSAPKRRCSLMTWRPISHLPHTISEFTLSEHITLHSLPSPPIPTSQTSSHTPSHSLEATSAFFIVRPRPYPPQIFPPLPV